MTRLYIIQLEKAGDKDVPVHGIIHVDTNDNLSSHQALTIATEDGVHHPNNRTAAAISDPQRFRGHRYNAAFEAYE